MTALLARALAFLTRLTLRRRRPTIVGITGSVGKTSTREAVFTVLSARYRTRQSQKNYNTEIGVPLAVLGIPHYGRNPFGWAWGLAKSAFRLLVSDRGYPEVLVLELGADRPGDIVYLSMLVRPNVGVITAVSEVPVHVEFFSSPEELAAEKGELIAALPVDGCAVLNADDPRAMGLVPSTQARVLSFGFASGADVRISNYELITGEWNGIRFDLECGGRHAAVRIKNAFGRQQASAAAAAAAVGVALKVDFADAALALASYSSPSGRMKLLKGNKGSLILDDTYNASPAAAEAALDVLAAFPAKRRVFVLGDMLELGAYTEPAHRAIGAKAAEVADVFFGVGERMKFALDEARQSGRAIETQWFAASQEAGRPLEAILRPDDVVLVKGSQGMRMERVVLEVMAEPQRAKEVLVRQDDSWQGKK